MCWCSSNHSLGGYPMIFPEYLASAYARDVQIVKRQNDKII
jgi:hypothetical protein